MNTEGLLPVKDRKVGRCLRPYSLDFFFTDASCLWLRSLFSMLTQLHLYHFPASSFRFLFLLLIASQRIGAVRVCLCRVYRVNYLIRDCLIVNWRTLIVYACIATINCDRSDQTTQYIQFIIFIRNFMDVRQCTFGDLNYFS